MTTPQAEQILDMMRYTAVGTGEQVAEYLQEFAVMLRLMNSLPYIARCTKRIA